MVALLEARLLGKSYAEGGTESPVLSDVNLSVDRGEILSITGASGAGKSTLLHLLGTIEVPTSGQVFFEGDDVLSYSERDLAEFRNKKLGFIFQFHHLLAEFNALENVSMPLMLRGMPGSAIREQAVSALKDVGMEHKLSSLPGELSGGEQQRVAVARAIVTAPILLLADEPTGNLDRQTGTQLMELLFDLNQARDLTLIYVTHNDELAARAGRTLHMQDGKLQ